ncbi:hypothetical protein ABZT27_15535 [Streptomyces sp. NPDC005389]|uniref:hypothetical protein n=1 Tax=Streptomyces sp. NPDC005389 TaxID=3157040 RepID=UPI00339DEEB1
MSHELLDRVQHVLERAGYGPDSGIALHRHAHGVIISWNAEHLVRPTIAANAADAHVHAGAATPGVHNAPDIALTSVLRKAGLTAAHHPDGFILVHIR